MALNTGTRLGPYEILAPLGAGGMGEVYRAKDTRLDRTVAVKVLPEHLAADAAGRQRLEREAKAVSALNHPHICVLHDVGQDGGVDFLVMEYLEGETLAQRLKKGPLPVDQVLRHGVEIADALDKAHRDGIVHRDLKPGNIVLTKGGAKLLDFGLAKLKRDGMSEAPAALSTLPTPAKPLTEKGTILGTLMYMAPEQLEGGEADARSDIWALGLVLYEMTTGKKAFSGKSQASLIGAILKEEPLSLTQHQPMTPPWLDRVVRNCLAKDPDERWQSAHDIVAQLRSIAEVPGGDVRGRGRPFRSERLLVRLLAAAVGLLAIALAVVVMSRQGEEPRVVRTAISLPEGTAVESISVSPDGRALAFAGSGADGQGRLWVRRLDNDRPLALPGTEGASFPFWSPDGRFLGFFAEGSLKKVDVRGGAAEALCPTPQPRGGTWSREGVIVFSPSTGSGLYRISAAGGTPTALTTLDAAKREGSHRWPCFLPDGRRVLYYARSGQQENSAIYVASLDSKEARRVITASSNAAYAPPGYLLLSLA